jgi:hypothetical protein
MDAVDMGVVGVKRDLQCGANKLAGRLIHRRSRASKKYRHVAHNKGRLDTEFKSAILDLARFFCPGPLPKF